MESLIGKIDIVSKGEYPSWALSNFAPNRFYFDGVDCWSMEGLINAFKFDDEEEQKEICSLVGIVAKVRASHKEWWHEQKLYWRGVTYERESDEYQDLLDRAYLALAQNSAFRKALLATGDKILTHKIGGQKSSETVLTEQEFCSRLNWIRYLIKENKI